MAAQSDIKQRVDLESDRRARLGVPAAAGGVLFLISAIVINAVITSLPSVGLLQGLKSALNGESNPAVSARAAEVKVLSHHALGLIAGSLLEAVALVALTVTLVFILDCTRFRRPETSSVPRTLVLLGGFGLAVLSVVAQVVRAIQTHNFATGHDFSEHAVEKALQTGAANVVVDYLGLLLPLLLAVGMIITLLSATRVGLIPRWLRGLGLAAAVMLLPFFAQILYLQLIPAAWLVAVGFMFLGRLPNGDPPAWEAGESVPWPSQAELRAQSLDQKQKGGATKDKSKAKAKEVDSPAAEDAAQVATPSPVVPAPSPAAKRRRRKRR